MDTIDKFWIGAAQVLIALALFLWGGHAGEHVACDSVMSHLTMAGYTDAALALTAVRVCEASDANH